MRIENFWGIMPLLIGDDLIRDMAESQIEALSRHAATLIQFLQLMVRHGNVRFTRARHHRRQDPIMRQIHYLNYTLIAMIGNRAYNLLYRTAIRDRQFRSQVDYELMDIKIHCSSAELFDQYVTLLFLKRYIMQPNNIVLVRQLALNHRRLAA